jgi:hypothetical protein
MWFNYGWYILLSKSLSLKYNFFVLKLLIHYQMMTENDGDTFYEMMIKDMMIWTVYLCYIIMIVYEYHGMLLRINCGVYLKLHTKIFLNRVFVFKYYHLNIVWCNIIWEIMYYCVWWLKMQSFVSYCWFLCGS